MTPKDITPHVNDIEWEVTGDGIMAVCCKTPEREALVMLGLREWCRDVEARHTDPLRSQDLERAASARVRLQRENDDLKRQLGRRRR